MGTTTRVTDVTVREVVGSPSTRVTFQGSSKGRPRGPSTPVDPKPRDHPTGRVEKCKSEAIRLNYDRNKINKNVYFLKHSFPTRVQ